MATPNPWYIIVLPSYCQQFVLFEYHQIWRCAVDCYVYSSCYHFLLSLPILTTFVLFLANSFCNRSMLNIVKAWHKGWKSCVVSSSFWKIRHERTIPGLLYLQKIVNAFKRDPRDPIMILSQAFWKLSIFSLPPPDNSFVHTMYSLSASQ